MRATSRLSAAHAAAPASPLPWQEQVGRTDRRPRVLLPGAGHWAWWGWALYALVLGPPLVLGLAAAAALRVVLPTRQRVWAFRRRRTALTYLATLAVLASSAAAVAGTSGWLATASTHPLATPPPAAGADAGGPTRLDGGTHPAAPTMPAAPAGSTAREEAPTGPAGPDVSAAPAATEVDLPRCDGSGTHLTLLANSGGTGWCVAAGVDD